LAGIAPRDVGSSLRVFVRAANRQMGPQMVEVNLA
jgi:hypothetical protein